MRWESDERIARELSALGHPARLAVVRELVAAGPAGLAAGTLSKRLGMAPSALTFHLQKLAAKGLVSARRQGQFVYYRADFEVLLALTDYLTGACCSESQQNCGPRCPSNSRP